MKRYLNLTLIAIVCFCYLINIVKAGGPLIVNKNGEPVTWDRSRPVPFTPDQGTLGKFSNSEAVQITNELFNVWENVSTASITFKQEGQLSKDITGSNFLDFCNNLTSDVSPIIFDTDGSVIDAVFGVGANESTIGFAGPEIISFTNGIRSSIASGLAVMNGKFFDGKSNPTDLTLEDFRGTFVHEFGHYINLAHTQINLEQLPLNDPANSPLMFPIAIDGIGETLRADDVAAVSSLYPISSFKGSTGIIRGRIFLPDGTTQFQGANVIARMVSNPKVAAVSSFSGFLHLDPINPSFGGSDDAELLGFYEIKGLVPGDYTISIEQIDSSFSGGSSVGSLDTPVPLPGIPEFYNEGESNSDTQECAGIISIGAGQVVENIDIIINNSGTIGNLVGEQEPNNFVSEAQAISTLSTVSGEISKNEQGHPAPNGDDFEDMFSFTIKNTQFISIHLSFQESDSDLDLMLFDENLRIFGISESSGDATESLGPILLSPGVYFIGVSFFDFGFLNPSTDYTLDIVRSCGELDADFTSNPTGGKAPLTVQFTDLSDGKLTKWNWHFGDGGTSENQNPTHTYSLNGDYTVQLTVEDESGISDTITKVDFINVNTGTSSKSFTFNCENTMERGPILGLEKITMNVGDTENCTLKLTNREPDKTVEIASRLRKWFGSAIEIEPSSGVTDENGELEITLTALRKGINWTAWAVQNDRGQFKFNKKSYDTGLAWGMFVRVR
ncbi:MAG: PKD domain-containing protein [Candidatus Anammoxibacter sp.]